MIGKFEEKSSAIIFSILTITFAVIARDSKVFVADKLSDTNKAQLDSLWIAWVELRNINWFTRFENVLKMLEIPHWALIDLNDANLENIFTEIF